MTTLDALQKVGESRHVIVPYHIFNCCNNAGGCDPIIVFIQGSRERFRKNHHCSSKLPKEAVEDIGRSNRLSFNYNDEAPGENVKEGMEVGHGIGDLMSDCRPDTGVIEPAIKNWGEDDKYAEI